MVLSIYPEGWDGDARGKESVFNFDLNSVKMQIARQFKHISSAAGPHFILDHRPLM